MKTRFVAIFLVLVLASLACNIGGNSAPPAAEAPSAGNQDPAQTGSGGPVDAPTAVPTQPQSGVSLPFLSDKLDLGSLSPNPFESYAQDATVHYEGLDPSDAPLSLTYQMTLKTQSQPEPGEAQTIISTTNGEVNTTETITLGGTMYTVVQGTGCLSMAASASGTSSGVDELTNGVENEVQRVESGVVVNDIETDRYALTAENFLTEPGDTTFTDFTFQEGSVYIARSGGFLVRLELIGHTTASETSLTQFKPGPVSTQIVVDLKEAPGGTWNLQIPAACTGQVESPYPVMDDASNLTHVGFTLYYYTKHTMQDAVAFYREHMPAEGWTAGEEFINPTDATLAFTKDGVTVKVNIMNYGADTLLVNIVEQE